jgi:N-acetyl-gamma-glutamylphosphate reductase
MSGQAATTKAQKAELRAEGILAAHIVANPGHFDTATLARSYALPVERVAQIVKRNGGTHG